MDVVLGHRRRGHVGPQMVLVDHHVLVQHDAEVAQQRLQPGLDERIEHEQRVAARGEISGDGVDFLR